MKIGLLRVDLKIPCCSSLKEKRSIIKRYINKLRREYNVSVAELKNHDQYHACRLGIVTIYNDSDNVERTLRVILDLLDDSPDVQIREYNIEMM